MISFKVFPLLWISNCSVESNSQSFISWLKLAALFSEFSKCIGNSDLAQKTVEYHLWASISTKYMRAHVQNCLLDVVEVSYNRLWDSFMRKRQNSFYSLKKLILTLEDSECYNRTNSLPSSAKVKNVWRYIYFHSPTTSSWCGIYISTGQLYLALPRLKCNESCIFFCVITGEGSCVW